MNIETGEIHQFENFEDLENFFESKKPQERENWVEIDPSKMTKKQQATKVVDEHDHRSHLAVCRDIMRKRKRSARRKELKNGI
jgi:hypothetical protein